MNYACVQLAGSIYASNIGAQMFVGLAGSAAAFGFAPVMFEWHVSVVILSLEVSGCCMTNGIVYR
jgi:solute carrier family 5 (sodium/glucose cotransporter), member 9